MNLFRMKRLLIISILLLTMTSFIPIMAKATDDRFLPNTSVTDIEVFVDEQMAAGKIPGLGIVIIQGDKTLYQQGFGYADVSGSRKVESDTLFELGSTSKAFTAHALFQLAEEGLVQLDDPITRYIPWLTMTYQGELADVTVKQFLHHTSGVPFRTIGQIHSSTADNALEETVRTLVDIELSHAPGEKFEYATINYDVIGYLIEQVSGISFEAYMERNVFQKLALENTYFPLHAPMDKMAKGYKIGFGRAQEYQAPVYRGNNPAGYVISSLSDIEQWMKMQLDSVPVDETTRQLIATSHQPDRTVAPDYDGSSYAGGWSVYQSGGGAVAHSGNNPNFSSFFVFRPEEELAVAVLANMNSDYTTIIGQGIMNMLQGEEAPQLNTDLYIKIDQISTALVLILLSTALLTLFFLIRILVQVFQKKRVFARLGVGRFILLGTLFCVTIGVLSFALYVLPEVFFRGLPWHFVYTWGPISLVMAVALVGIVGTLFSLYALLTKLFPSKKDRPIFYLGIFGVVSGLGNGLIILMVNFALHASSGFNIALFFYFLIGISLYMIAEKMVRTKLIEITNDIVYEKRMLLIHNILGASYQTFENIPDGKIYASLNNDTETIGRFSTVFITGLTSSITLFFCFIYLGFINLYGLLVSIGVIALAFFIYFLVGRSANLVWEQTRDIQNVFFTFIHDLVGGFKELYLNKKKQSGFEQAMEESCDTYRKKRALGEKKFVNVFVIGELLFVFVIGTVAFFFPVFFPEITKEALLTYVFVFLYMTGPVHGILNSFPEILRIRISWKRVNALLAELSVLSPASHEVREEPREAVSMKLEEVTFQYRNEKGKTFTVGPLNDEFHAGEIIFIIGGNGSGKSTLAKLITGLYTPDSGVIKMNHQHRISLLR
ncbi:serine hydrolase [Caldalkalibacillus mannanilyticus]|uniref:serine hydrolase n=1 Tax=Caldalkalibacillus mannanilyticus TaxID=1418 RepID=UPI0022773369|nr:serine hydrolase [Caldalkalibacillus mannanilyticus]